MGTKELTSSTFCRYVSLQNHEKKCIMATTSENCPISCKGCDHVMMSGGDD